jgi:hypothetical protein
MEWRALPPGTYDAIVDEVDFSFKAMVWLMVVYRVHHGGQEFRLRELLALDASETSADYQRTAEGKGRIKQILDAHGIATSSIKDYPDIPALLKDKAVRITVSHKTENGLKAPYVRGVSGQTEGPPPAKLSVVRSGGKSSGSAAPMSDDEKK